MCHVTRLRLRLLRGGALTPPRAAQTNYGGAQDGMSPYTPSFGTLEVLPPPGCSHPSLAWMVPCLACRSPGAAPSQLRKWPG